MSAGEIWLPSAPFLAIAVTASKAMDEAVSKPTREQSVRNVIGRRTRTQNTRTNSPVIRNTSTTILVEL